MIEHAKDLRRGKARRSVKVPKRLFIKLPALSVMTYTT